MNHESPKQKIDLEFYKDLMGAVFHMFTGCLFIIIPAIISIWMEDDEKPKSK